MSYLFLEVMSFSVVSRQREKKKRFPISNPKISYELHVVSCSTYCSSPIVSTIASISAPRVSVYYMFIIISLNIHARFVARMGATVVISDIGRKIIKQSNHEKKS